MTGTKGYCGWCGAAGMHSTCKTCHFCGYSHISGSQLPQAMRGAPDFSYCPGGANVAGPKSQKLVGMRTLGFMVSDAGVAVLPVSKVILSDADIDLLQDDTSYNYFARPCPVRPRHGFVDSRLVKTKEDIVKLWKETREADPEGEVMLTPAYPTGVVANAIWTPTLLTIGAGNDGATSGKDTVNIPLVSPKKGSHYTKKIQELCEACKVGDHEAPYIETIFHEKGVVNPYGYNVRPMVTQLRAGPPLTGVGVDFIPHQVKVNRVEKVDGSLDLLQWEKRCEAVKEEEGLVFYHPGGSPADHFSVHARANGIPIVMSFEPEVGSTLDVPKNAIPPPDPRAVLEGLILGDKVDISKYPSELCALMLLAMHHSSVLGGQHGRLIGMGAALMMRYGGVALRGEARHRARRMGGVASAGPRDVVYKAMYPKSLAFHRASLSRLVNLFRYGNWQGAIGGMKWAQCGYSLFPMYNAARRLAREQSHEAVMDLLKAFNVAVNQAHNGGWWMNKFCAAQLFDTIQHNYPWAVLAAALPAWETMRATLKEDFFALKVERMANWPITQPRPLDVTKASLTFVPGTTGLQVSIQSRLLGKFLKPVVVPLDKVAEGFISLTTTDVWLVPAGEAFRLEARAGEKSVVLYEEPPLTTQPCRGAE